MKKNILKLLILCIFASNLTVQPIKADATEAATEAVGYSLTAALAVFILVAGTMKITGTKLQDVWNYIKTKTSLSPKNQKLVDQAAQAIIDNPNKDPYSIAEESGLPAASIKAAANSQPVANLAKDVTKIVISGSTKTDLLKKEIDDLESLGHFRAVASQYDYWEKDLKNMVENSNLNELSTHQKNLLLQFARESIIDNNKINNLKDVISLLNAGADFSTAQEAKDFVSNIIRTKANSSNPDFITLLKTIIDKTQFKNEVIETIKTQYKGLIQQGSKTTAPILETFLNDQNIELQKVTKTAQPGESTPQPTKTLTQELGLTQEHIKTLQDLNASHIKVGDFYYSIEQGKPTSQLTSDQFVFSKGSNNNVRVPETLKSTDIEEVYAPIHQLYQPPMAREVI